MNSITIKNKNYKLPTFLPDATYGVSRSLSFLDLKKTNIKGVVVNTFHLKDHPGIEVLKKFQGIKNFMNFRGLVTSDSGGFQLFSLIQKNPNLGKITDEGVILYSGPKKRKKSLFTPEDSIKIQFEIQSDIMYTLDDFTPDQADKKRTHQSINRTIDWAQRCKREFQCQCQKRKLSDNNRPYLFAPIQGGRYQDLRQECASKLIDIGFDGFGLGGWPFHQGKFDYEMCHMNAKLTPDDKPRFALGVGKPENIVLLYFMGYSIFDCVLPTRDARHQRLYVFNKNQQKISWPEKKKITEDEIKSWYDYLYIKKSKFKKDATPISPHCQCFTCQHYSKGYLYHLFKVNDTLAYRLASIHNLQFYADLIQLLRKTKKTYGIPNFDHL